MSKIILILFFFLIGFNLNTFSQDSIKKDSSYFNNELFNFGYSYDSLLNQLNKWCLSPYIVIDSIGASVLGRAIWMLTIKGSQNHFEDVYRVAIHARTHPGEVQSEWLTHRIVEYLIEDSPFAELLRDRFVFNIVPMYNPDGVELGYGRENANHVDLERNWFTYPHEPEVEALKNKYFEFMNSSHPIRIALNMHGAGASKDFFVFHHENGTSLQFVEDQKNFIAAVRNHYITGIHDWNYQVTWTTGNPLVYPESWFWLHYQEAVMALTHEKIPTQSSNNVQYDSAAYALLHGIIDYLEVTTEIGDVTNLPDNFTLYQNFPNPFNPVTTIRFQIPSEEFVAIKIYNTLGQEIRTIFNEFKKTGVYEVLFDGSDLSSGIYVYRITAGNFTAVKKMVLMR